MPRPPDPSPAAPPTFLEILRDDRGRTVVVIGGTGAAADAAGPHTPRTAGAGDRRRRIWCVLIDESGTLIDAMYDEGRGPERLLAEVVTPLLSDGYGHLHEPLSEVRRRVAEAARKGASSGRLPAAYYLGRDLLDLGDIHVAERAAPDLRATLLGRAVDLLALGQAARARPLLERCAGEAPDDAVAASSLGLCLLAIGDVTAARTWLERAAALEPGWPIHHWNAAAAAHRAGRTGACYLALRRFLDVAAAVRRDGELDARADVARRFVADYERMCRLEGHDPARRAAAEARRPVLRSRTHRTSGASRPAHPAETPR